MNTTIDVCRPPFVSAIRRVVAQRTLAIALLVGSLAAGLCPVVAQEDSAPPVRVFIFAGQSNMVGSDSKVADIERFPPFRGLEEPRPDVRFAYCIGRENKRRSDGWVPLAPVNGVVGPELSFARDVTRKSDGPIAIIKVAAGGTHLGGDWNPDEPSGFKMYPLFMEVVKSSLAELKVAGVEYQLEGFMWHQGENDMFNPEYMKNYGDNLANFVAAVRRDLAAPKLRFYVGELCTKTIWGMDLRPRMYAISLGQKDVAASDPLVDYVPTSHIGVEIGRPVGLHYHYGTLGQLEHGVNYANAYLANIGKPKPPREGLERWPYRAGETVKLFVLAGHRNMEGERAFTQELAERDAALQKPLPQIAYRFRLGGGVLASADWEPLAPSGYYDTFGPEVSFARGLGDGAIAIAKFTHSGSQMNDWTPDGSEARTRHIYPQFIQFVKETIQDLERRGHPVEVAGIFYHVGENEMSMPPYRRQAAKWLAATIHQSRVDLDLPRLKWFVTQQPPTDHKNVNSLDVVGEIAKLASEDPHWVHIQVFELPPQPKILVLNTAGIVRLGEEMAAAYRKSQAAD